MILATYRIITTDICKWSTWGWWDLTLALPLELQARSPEMDLIIYLKSTTILVGWLYFKTILRLSFVQIAKTLVPAPFPHRPTHHFKPRRLWDYCTAVDNCQLIYSLDFSGILLGLLHCWWYVSTHILSCLMTRSFVDDVSLSTKLFRSTTLPVMQRRRGRGWSSRKVCCWKTRQAVQTLHHPRLLLNETKSLKLASMAQLYISGQASLSSMVSPYQSCFMIRPNEFLHPMFWKKSNWSS